jgi:2-isopropylmalate synthase
MPARRYRAFPPVQLPDRRWPERSITRPPTWCSVDLRDGNQALVEPMGPERKLRMFEQLVAMGFQEIEVGFPSASETELAFLRKIIDEGRVPEAVTLQVLTQAREELIDRTMDAIRGVRRAIVHVYNSTSSLQRRVVFGLDRAGIVEIAVRGVERVAELAAELPDTEIVLEYSPESFTATELDFSLEICEAVMSVWQPSRQRPLISTPTRSNGSAAQWESGRAWC